MKESSGYRYTLPGSGLCGGYRYTLLGSGLCSGYRYTLPGSSLCCSYRYTLPGSGLCGGYRYTFPGSGLCGGYRYTLPGLSSALISSSLCYITGRLHDSTSQKQERKRKMRIATKREVVCLQSIFDKSTTLG